MDMLQCAICGKGFRKKTRYETHMTAAHPGMIPSFDAETLLEGMAFPKTKHEIVSQALGRSDDATIGLLNQIDDREYNHPSEVVKQLASLRESQDGSSQEPAAPSKLPGRRRIREKIKDDYTDTNVRAKGKA